MTGEEALVQLRNGQIAPRGWREHPLSLIYWWAVFAGKWTFLRSEFIPLWDCSGTAGQDPPSLPSASAQMLPVMIHAHYGKLHPGPCRKPSGKLCLVKSPGCGRWEAHRLVTTIEPGRLTPHSRLEPETRPCPYQVLSITSWPEEAPQQRGNFVPKTEAQQQELLSPQRHFWEPPAAWVTATQQHTYSPG